MTDLENDHIYRVQWSKEKRLLINSQRAPATSASPNTHGHPKSWEESNLTGLKTFPNF